MTITTSLMTILEDTTSAITSDPGLAAVRFAADCELVGVTEVDVRLHNRVVKADQPPVLGGNDVGPKPVEIAPAALGSCQAMTYRFWSEKLGIHINKLTIDVQGDLDLHGIPTADAPAARAPHHPPPTATRACHAQELTIDLGLPGCLASVHDTRPGRLGVGSPTGCRYQVLEAGVAHPRPDSHITHRHGSLR